MNEENEENLALSPSQAGRGSARFISQSGGGLIDKGDKGPFVIQKLTAVRPTYSYPGSVAKSDIYNKFRFITEEMMEKVIHEAKENMAGKKPKMTVSKGKTKTSSQHQAGLMDNDVSKAQYDKWMKQIKWFWLEIEDYLREIETVYNEVRLHAETFESKRKDKEEEIRRNKRIADFNARSCRIVYDLQQQTKEVFSLLESSHYALNRSSMKKLHSIHRGVVTALHNLLTRLPDYDLDRGLPPVYHQLAMLIRRLAQCCFKLNIGHDVHIIRNLEGIRQKMEDANQDVGQEMPLYKMTPASKKPPTCTQWDPKGGMKTCPVVWQEYEAHMKGKRIPKSVPNKILDMVDVSKKQGFIAPVHLQSGIDRYLRIKSPLLKHDSKSSARGATGKFLSALGKPSSMTNDEFDAIAHRFKKLQQEFITEVEGQISARLKPLLQEAKKVADAHAKDKKVVTVGHVRVESPRNPFSKQKVNVDELLSYYTGAINKVEIDHAPMRALKDSPVSGDEGWGDIATERADEDIEQPPRVRKERRRSRSPVTMRQRSESKQKLAVEPPPVEKIDKLPRIEIIAKAEKSVKKETATKRELSPKKDISVKREKSVEANALSKPEKTIRRDSTLKPPISPSKEILGIEKEKSTKRVEMALRAEIFPRRKTSPRGDVSPLDISPRDASSREEISPRDVTSREEMSSREVSPRDKSPTKKSPRIEKSSITVKSPRVDKSPRTPELSPRGDKSATNAGLKSPRRSQPTVKRSSSGLVVSGPSKSSVGNTPDGDYVPKQGSKIRRGVVKTGKNATKTHTKASHSAGVIDNKGALALTLHEDDDDRKTVPQAESKQPSDDDEELQWEMRGSLSTWSPNQMLHRVNEMSTDNTEMRRRWKDILHKDPSATGVDSNYRLTYGEESSYADTKEPDLILLMKQSSQKDTLVAVSAIPEMPEDASQFASDTLLLEAAVSRELRARAGDDPSPRDAPLLCDEYKTAIMSYRSQYDEYLQKSAHNSSCCFDPWKVILEAADSILNDIIQDVGNELTGIHNDFVEDVYDAEFARS